MEVRIATDALGAAREAAAWCASALRDAVDRRGRASVASSGGSTPAPMFDALVELAVPWSSVTVLQVDERVAPDGDPDRNATELVARLLDPAGVPPSSRLLMPVTTDDLEAAAADYAALVDDLVPIDVVHLGLGDDGHTASWPPGDPVVDTPSWVGLSGVYRGHRRMTLTPAAVNGARSRVVLITGASKAPVVARWLDGDPTVPVQRVERESTVLFLDEAAAPWPTRPHR